jgi:hypothetical protein
MSYQESWAYASTKNHHCRNRGGAQCGVASADPIFFSNLGPNESDGTTATWFGFEYGDEGISCS